MIPKSIALVAAAALLLHATYTALITAWTQHANHGAPPVGADGYTNRPSGLGSTTALISNAPGDLASPSPASPSSFGQRLAGMIGGSTLARNDDEKYSQNAQAHYTPNGQPGVDSRVTNILAGASGSSSGNAAELSSEAKAAIDAEVAAYASRLAQIVSFAPPTIAQVVPSAGNVAQQPAPVPESGISDPAATRIGPLRVKSPPRPRPQPMSVPLPSKPAIVELTPPPQAFSRPTANKPIDVAPQSASMTNAAIARGLTNVAAAVARDPSLPRADTAVMAQASSSGATSDTTASLSAVEAAFVSADGSPRSVLFNPKYAPSKSDVLVYVHVPKTAGSVFFDKMRARAKGLRYYPDGQHSFHDRGYSAFEIRFVNFESRTISKDVCIDVYCTQLS